MKKKDLLYLTMSLMLSFSVAGQEDKESPFYVNHKQLSWVDSIMSNMTIEEKIGQLFTIDVYSKSDDYLQKARRLVNKYHVGGVIFLEGNPQDQVMFTNALQDASKIPLLVSMDAEWGVSMRLPNTPRLPLQLQIAATNNPENSYLVSEVIAEQCRRLGVHMNFAPIADINSNPENPVIGRRSFGENKTKVADLSISSVEAYTNNGIIACVKHFPGHGDTFQDSHNTLAAVNKDAKSISEQELYPFKQLINAKAPAVMVAHLDIPSITGQKELPTSLSYRVVDSILKTEFDFKGLVVSDALNMKGARSYGNEIDVNIQALKAGNDILLFAQNIGDTQRRIKREIDRGDISLERIDHSVRKILMAKYWAGLGDYHPVNPDRVVEDLNRADASKVIYKVAQESITLLKNKNNVLPLTDLEQSIAHVIFVNDNLSEFISVSDNYSKIDNYRINPGNFQRLKKEIRKHDRIIISIDYPLLNIKGSEREKYYRLINDQIDYLAKDKKIILNFMGNPYSIKNFGNDDNFDAILISYKNSDVNQQIAASTIFGANSPRGVLPVSISEKYPEGSSMSFGEIGRLAYSSPELQGMDSNILSEIDSIVNTAINDTVMPGAQVLVARNGKIVYEKTFGYKTYKKEHKIERRHLYDIASVTKIMVTTPILMKMVDEGDIDIDLPISEYLPGLDTTSKSNLTIREMLAHYSGLQPWIPFFKRTLTPSGLPDRKKYYTFNPDSKHKLKVSDNLYLRTDCRDSMFYVVEHSPLLDSLEYKYSDLPYYLVHKIIEKKKRKSLDKLADEYFFSPLGLQRMLYKPKNKFEDSDIVPSEIETYFRNKELWGDVNDPGAAMLGGVGAHAGVFANSHSLAVMMQMYVQDGFYGAKRYFDPKTLNDFTRCQFCHKGNRRGVGFDKPQLEGEGPTCDCISFLSFGHSGFTGTMAWADPDENIVYIFLSNRTYPTSENNKLVEQNIRTKIQSVIYKSFYHEH